MKPLKSAVVLAFALLMAACTPQAVTESDIPYITVVTDLVTSGVVEDFYSLNGTVSHNQENLVFSPATSEVLAVHVKNGDAVLEGDILIELDQEAIEKQLEQTKKSLDLAYVSYNSASERYKDALATLERTQQLYDQGAISKQQLEQAQLAASNSPVTSARLQYEQTRLQYENLSETLEDSSITADAPGTITNLSINSGDMVQAGSILCKIIDDSTFKLELKVSENVVQHLALGDEASIIIPVIDSTYTGLIVEISPTPGLNSKLYPISIHFEGDSTVKSGMYSEVVFDLSSGIATTRIPSLAVLKDNSGYYVFKVTGETSVRQPVSLGFDNGYFVEVIDGLMPGDEIVVKGQQFIRDDIETKYIRRDEE